jgi:catechol 2,3-dioxygenase-like lactoylglutathione lyase family enzyme
MPIAFDRTTPVLRIFDEAKAREFYLGFLGFTVDWEARFDDNAPIYMQVSRDNLVLHLSEHHGDGSPGSVVYVTMAGIDELHAELIGRHYKYNRPGILDQPWGMRELYVDDPFGNKIRFGEEKPK